MHTLSTTDIEQLIREKYVRGEAWFRAGEMRNAVEALYTEDLRYLAPNIQPIEGRSASSNDFKVFAAHCRSTTCQAPCSPGAIRRSHPTWSGTGRTAAADSADVSRAHYIAAFRQSTATGSSRWRSPLQATSFATIRILTALES